MTPTDIQTHALLGLLLLVVALLLVGILGFTVGDR